MIPATASRSALALTLVTLCAGCGDELPTQSSVIGGIVRTNSAGAILSDDDPSDWLPRTTGGSDGGPGVISGAPTQGLRPAFPNPAVAQSSIDFAILRSSEVRVDVTDDKGDVVTVLIDTDTLEAGEHILPWDLTNTSGSPLPNGFYRVRFTFQPGRFEQGYWRADGETWTSHGDIEIVR